MKVSFVIGGKSKLQISPLASGWVDWLSSGYQHNAFLFTLHAAVTAGRVGDMHA
jgi:hypothetical protein